MLIANFALNSISDGVVLDTFGLGHVGLCTNTTIVHNPESKFPKCMAFNGSSSKISIANLVCPLDFTIASWVRKGPDLSYYYAAVVAFGNDLPFLGFYGGKPVLANALTSSAYLDSEWNHLAALQDSNGCRLYLNGELIASAPSRARIGGRGMFIGGNSGRGNAWFQGEIACVTLFNEALSEEELRRLMLATLIPRTERVSIPIVESEPATTIENNPSTVIESEPAPAPPIIVDPNPIETHPNEVVEIIQVVNIEVVEEKPAPVPVVIEVPIVIEAPSITVNIINVEIEAAPCEARIEAITNEIATEASEVVTDLCEVARDWSFECKLEIDAFTHSFQVFIASIKTIEAPHFEQEVTFSIEVFGKQVLLPIRHRKHITRVEDYSRIFNEHAFAEFAQNAAVEYKNECARNASEWLRNKMNFNHW